MGLEVELTATTTSDELVGILEGITAFHEFLAAEEGMAGTPVMLQRIKHPNSVIVIASAFLLAHRALFVAVAPYIGRFTTSAAQWRTAALNLKRAEVDKERVEKELELLKLKAGVPEDRLREAYRQARKIADAVKDLDEPGRTELLAQTLEQLLPEEDRAGKPRVRIKS